MTEFNSSLDYLNEFEPMAFYGGNQRLLFDAFRECLKQDSQMNSALWEALWMVTAEGSNLDEHGVVFNLPRNEGETDTDYRARLLTVLRSRAIVGTPEAIHDAVEAALSERDCGVIYLKDRVALEQDGEPICPIGSITAPPDMSLFAYLLYLVPGHDLTDVALLVNQLEQTAALRDNIIICEVDEDSVTPEQLVGIATSSSTISADYGPGKAIDGQLGGPTGLNAFYWAMDDMPSESNTPWWQVELTTSRFTDLLMIAQQPRHNVNRLKDVRITLTPPADCDVPELVYQFRLPDIGADNFDRWFFPLPRPTWVETLKIEVLSIYDIGMTLINLAEVELYAPDAWTRITLKEI